MKKIKLVILFIVLFCLFVLLCYLYFFFAIYFSPTKVSQRALFKKDVSICDAMRKVMGTFAIDATEAVYKPRCYMEYFFAYPEENPKCINLSHQERVKCLKSLMFSQGYNYDLRTDEEEIIYCTSGEDAVNGDGSLCLSRVAYEKKDINICNRISTKERQDKCTLFYKAFERIEKI